EHGPPAGDEMPCDPHEVVRSVAGLRNQCSGRIPSVALLTMSVLVLNMPLTYPKFVSIESPLDRFPGRRRCEEIVGFAARCAEGLSPSAEQLNICVTNPSAVSPPSRSRQRKSPPRLRCTPDTRVPPLPRSARRRLTMLFGGDQENFMIGRTSIDPKRAPGIF